LPAKKEEILNGYLIDYYMKASTWEETLKITITGRKHRLETNREGTHPTQRAGRTAKGKT